MNINSPLRLLDVPDPDGGPLLDQWAILSQHQPLVLAHAEDAAVSSWSSHKSDALLMSWPKALRCAQRLVADGEAIVLVRGNEDSWQWLMLVTEWPRHTGLEH